MANDTHANILLNIIIRKYGKLPTKYRIIGFDNSPISREAIIPISTIGQQVEVMADTAMELLIMQINERRKRKPGQLAEPIHKTITPVLNIRETAFPVLIPRRCYIKIRINPRQKGGLMPVLFGVGFAFWDNGAASITRQRQY